MSSEYYTLEKTSEVLGLATADVTRMRERGELRAFRDGSSWKFRKVEVDNRLADKIRERSAKTAAAADDSAAEEAFVVASGVGAIDFDDALNAAGNELALSLDKTPSTTLTTKPTAPAAVPAEDDLATDDDLLVAEDLKLADDDLKLAPAQEEDAEDEAGLFEVDSADDDDTDTYATADDDSRTTASASDDIGSEQLGGSGLDLDDEDALMAFIAEDDIALSSVATKKPADKSVGKKPEAALTTVKAAAKAADGEDFDLDPGSMAAEESESASQVIAVDDAAMSQFGFGSSGGAGANEVEVTSSSEEMFASADTAAGSSPVFGGGASGSLGDYTTPSTAAVLTASRPEPQFSGMAIYLGLVPCLAVVMLAGMMTLDLIRFMWSWGQPNAVSSAMLNALASLLGMA